VEEEEKNSRLKKFHRIGHSAAVITVHWGLGQKVAKSLSVTKTC
jgi:hypothetical protein